MATITHAENGFTVDLGNKRTITSSKEGTHIRLKVFDGSKLIESFVEYCVNAPKVVVGLIAKYSR